MVIRDLLKRGASLLVLAGLVPASAVYAQAETCRDRGEGKVPNDSSSWSWIASLGDTQSKERTISVFVKPYSNPYVEAPYLYHTTGSLFAHYRSIQGKPMIQHFSIEPPFFPKDEIDTDRYMSYFLEVKLGQATDALQVYKYGERYNTREPRQPRPRTLGLKVLNRVSEIEDKDKLIEAKFTVTSVVQFDPKVGYPQLLTVSPASTKVYYSMFGLNAGYNQALLGLEDLDRRLASGQCVREKPGDQQCFITTATVDTIGLRDDCWELQTLRRFRDGWLARQADGPARIAAYYQHAPAISERLKNDPARLIKLYWTRILPSAVAAKVGANRFADRLYTRMMGELGVRV